MKKLIIFLLSIVVVTLSIKGFSAPNYITPLHPIKVFINAKEIKLNLPIIMENNRACYPFREMLESVGASVYWDADQRKASAKLDGKEVLFVIGSSDYFVNGVKSKMDTQSFINEYHNKTYIPIRYACEGLGFSVEWLSKGEIHIETVINGNFATATPVPVVFSVTPSPSPMVDEHTVIERVIADPDTLPKIYFNKVSESGVKPAGFVEPRFYAKVVNNYVDYFTVYLENALDFKNIAMDVIYQVKYVDYPSLDTVSNIFGEITVLGEKKLSDGIVQIGTRLRDTNIKSNDKLSRGFDKPSLREDKIILIPRTKIKSKIIFKYKSYVQEYFEEVVLNNIEPSELN